MSAADIATGAFKFRLAGDKLNGGWMLTRLKPKPGEKKRNWLLFKERDQAADPATDILAARPESVKTGRRIEELVAPPAPPRAGEAAAAGVGCAGAVKGPAPEGLAPQLAARGGASRRRGTTGCTRSSSTATGRWPSATARRCGW